MIGDSGRIRLSMMWPLTSTFSTWTVADPLGDELDSVRSMMTVSFLDLGFWIAVWDSSPES
jgi:hypothetical protein